MDIEKLVDDLTADDQNKLLTELMNRNRIAVNVASRDETVDVDDVYCNSSPHQMETNPESNGVLTIILIDNKD